MIVRNPNNPLIKKTDVQPTRDGLQVIGIFNPGACLLNGEIILLMRVAEASVPEPGWVKVPVVRIDGDHRQVDILAWRDDADLDDQDPRKFIHEGKMYLSSLSHLRLARSKDGVHFQIDPEPFLFPERPDEAFGVEDPRITHLEGRYAITYTAVSGDGYGVGLATTADFTDVQRHGMIFPPMNKDACIFPEKIGGRYVALHRPIARPMAKPSIWYAESPDLLHWGKHACLLRPRDTRWEKIKIGAGPEPIKTPEGWLLLYHGCGENEAYSLFVCLLDPDDPRRVLKRGSQPILTPEIACEKSGFFPNVVFSNGWVRLPDGRVLIYYGGADESICMAETTVEGLMGCLE